MSEGITIAIIALIGTLGGSLIGTISGHKINEFRIKKTEEKVTSLETVQIELKDEQTKTEKAVARIEVRVEKIEEGDKKRDEKINKLENLHMSD